MNILTNLGKGKLSYILSAIAILWGIVGLIAGWIEAETAITVIYAGLAVFGIRRAIK